MEQSNGGCVQIENLTVSVYVGRDKADLLECVRGISLSIGEGQVLALVGESGSGKSLTAKAMLSLLDDRFAIRADTLSISGTDVLAASDEQMQLVRGNTVGFVSQDPMSALNPVLTIGTQLRQVIRAHLTIGADEARNVVRALLSEVGLRSPDALVQKYPHQLSGGMRQRVLIAMAVVCQPKLLIADEATTALDVTLQSQILKLFLHLRESRGMAVLMITHDLRITAEVADLVAVMYAGKIVEIGHVRSVIDDPIHPYTRALLDSMPKIEGTSALTPIAGTPAQPGEFGDGCAFAPRCPLVEEICRSSDPPYQEMAGGRKIACWVRGSSQGQC